MRCRPCGIVTHGEPLDPKPGARQGADLRNFEPPFIETRVVRRFDGADTWALLD